MRTSTDYKLLTFLWSTFHGHWLNVSVILQIQGWSRHVERNTRSPHSCRGGSDVELRSLSLLFFSASVWAGCCASAWHCHHSSPSPWWSHSPSWVPIHKRTQNNVRKQFALRHSFSPCLAICLSARIWCLMSAKINGRTADGVIEHHFWYFRVSPFPRCHEQNPAWRGEAWCAGRPTHIQIQSSLQRI